VKPDPKMQNAVKAAFPDLNILFAAGEDVSVTVNTPGWQHLMSLLEEMIAEIDSKLDSGHTPLTQAEYAMWHGRRGGLAGARDAAEAILHRYAVELAAQKAKHEGDAEPSLNGGSQ